MNLEERVTAIEEALGWHKQAQANTAPETSAKPQPARWEQAFDKLKKEARATTDYHLDWVQKNAALDMAFLEFRQSLASLPATGITEEDLDGLLNIVSPDVFVKRISTLKAKLGQPASVEQSKRTPTLKGMSYDEVCTELGKRHTQPAQAQLLTREQVAKWLYEHVIYPHLVCKWENCEGAEKDAVLDKADDLLALGGPVLTRERIVEATAKALDCSDLLTGPPCLSCRRKGEAIADKLLEAK